MPGMKKAKEDSLEYLKKLQEEAMAEVPSETPAEEIDGEEVAEDEAAAQLEDETPEEPANEETEEVPDEGNPSTAEAVPLPLGKGGDVENLDDSEETTPQSAEPTDPLTQGSQSGSDVDAVMAENKALKEEVESLRKALEEAGELAKESTVAVATGDLGDVDFSAFMYGDDEAKKGAAGQLMEYVMSNLQGRATPVLKEWDEAKHALAVQRAVKALSAMEDMFPGFGKEADAIEALIGRDKVLASYEDPMQARIAGYLINEGLKAVEKGKAGMSLDELMDIYRKNEEFKAAIEQDRLEKLKEAPELPPMPVSSSLSTHEPYTADVPKDMEAANKSLREFRKKFLK